MTRSLLALLALVACVVAVNKPHGPSSLNEFFLGSWMTTPTTDRPISGLHATTTHTITQRLDNFDTHNRVTFEQRYFSHGEHFRAGGPIYVILGSQRSSTEYSINYALIGSVARSEHGHVFLLESRFYGSSIPGDSQLTVEDLRYLTVDQSLADAAHFISHIKSVTPGAQNSPVVVLGQHYGGSLAVWFRQKYPHLAVAAWASSAPLLALQNNQQYKVYAGEAILELAGQECYDSIEAGFRELEAMAVAGELAAIGEMFDVCDARPLQQDNDVATLFLLVSEFFTFISNFRPEVPQVCEIFANSSQTPAQALAEVFNDYHYACTDVNYEAFIRQSEYNETTAYYGFRQKHYQQCTQLGWFATSESPNQPFGSFYPLAFFTEICTRLFGEVAAHAIAQENQDIFNIQYGGLNPAITNVLFTHGTYDPARSLGVRSDLSASAVSLTVPGVFAYDFEEIIPNNSQELIDVKLDIMAVLRSFTR